MKKLSNVLFSLVGLITLVVLGACNLQNPMGDFQGSAVAQERAISPTSPVAVNGALSINGNRLVNKNNVPVQLKGMSYFWSQWSGAFWNAGTVNSLVDSWGATIVRAAMGVEMGGYLSNPDLEKSRVMAVVDAAIAKGIYVIIDWHDHNAIANKAQAIAFFKEMAQKYGATPNVLFEIYNEPDGETWPQIKSYAQEVIAAIRGTGSNNIIIVGTPTWSQDVDQAANDPITGYRNIAYTLHYYAASHKQFLRDKAAYALSKGIALVVTEFGTCEATGDGFVDTVESQKWFDFLNANKISWMNWSLFDKQEAASALKPGASTTGPWPDSQLTASGLLIKAAMGGGGPNPGPQPPVVSITSPAPGATVQPGAQVAIAANASDSDGTVQSVAFYAGSQLLATDTSAPYGASYTAPASGTVVIKAIATDSNGLKTETSISISVQNQQTGGYKVTYTKTSDWGNGATIVIRIQNTGTVAINNWTLSFAYPGNQTITNSWSAQWTQSGNQVSAKPLEWNTRIEPGQWVEIGCNISFTGANVNPLTFTLAY